MMNMRPFFKRVCAYTIDLVIIYIITLLISFIPTVNKQMDDYQETYKEYETEYNKYVDYINLLDKKYDDKEINEEEYKELSEKEEYKEIISSRYEDNKISTKEYQEIVSEINKEFDLIAKDYLYILGKQGVSNSIITLVCTLLYFGVFQYFLKGQTIGKKLFKLKVVSASDKKLNIFNYLLRSLLVNDILLNGVGIAFLLLSSKSTYLKAENVISILISIVEAIIIFLVLTREDQRGLHDLWFNTKVISTEKNREEASQLTDNKKVIEAEIEEVKTKDNKEKNNKQKKSKTRK